MNEDEAIRHAGTYALSRYFLLPAFKDVLSKVTPPTDPADLSNFQMLEVFITGLHWRMRDDLEDIK